MHFLRSWAEVAVEAFRHLNQVLVVVEEVVDGPVTEAAACLAPVGTEMGAELILSDCQKCSPHFSHLLSVLSLPLSILLVVALPLLPVLLHHDLLLLHSQMLHSGGHHHPGGG